MKIAVEGCCHGELDNIYETLQFLENQNGVKVDLLLCCGDFQASRNEGDMNCMAVPMKYRHMQTFYKYYSGEKKAPVLTIFIGGNHEASNHLQELPFGGWVAPNIYYLGYAGVVRFKGIRIGGLSGIYKFHDYRKGHYELPPYNPETLRSVYHVRNIEVFKLKQIQMPMDIFLSHDWPQGIYNYGPLQELIRRKKFFQQEVESNSLGSPAAAELLAHLKPSFWFSAHLHVKFAAHMEHEVKGIGKPQTTKFLALDKCLPDRDFLQVIDVPERPGSSSQLEYDPEWLAILQATDKLQTVTSEVWLPPEDNGLSNKWNFSASEAGMMDVVDNLQGDLCIPENFILTVPSYDPNHPQPHMKPSYCVNPQTTKLCSTLGLTDIYALAGQCSPLTQSHRENTDDADLDTPLIDSSDLSFYNPDEINIEDEWEETNEFEENDETKENVLEHISKTTEGSVLKVTSTDNESECSSLLSERQGPLLLPPCSFSSGTEGTHLSGATSTTPLPTTAQVFLPSPQHLELSGEEETMPPKVQKRSSEDKEYNKNTQKIKRRNQAIYQEAEEDSNE